MSDFAVVLGPKAIGAEVLVLIAKGRMNGRLSFGVASRRRQLLFKGGRPEGVVEPGGEPSSERAAVVAAVRSFGASSTGRAVFEEQAVELPAGGTSLGLDTLGEALVSVLKTLGASQLEAFFEARGRFRAKSTASFVRLATISASILGSGDKLAPLEEPTPLVTLLGGASSLEQRIWAAMVVMGGVSTDAPPLTLAAPPPTQAAAPMASGPTADSPSTEHDATDDGGGETGRAIREAYEALGSDADHYAVLGVPYSAPAADIRKAYYRLAKEWHGDRLAGLGLPEATLKMAEELFRRADEANRVLCNEEERSSYDWVLDRQAKGLPTDPKAIMDAESSFRRAEGLVRRGQVAAAKPLLQEAVALNKGEAEFWAFLGFATYATEAAAGLDEARAALDKALGLRPELDVAYEFLGRIAHAEGDFDTAQAHLQRCIEINPKNADAQRELRLIAMRRAERQAARTKEKEKAKGGLFGKLLKR